MLQPQLPGFVKQGQYLTPEEIKIIGLLPEGSEHPRPAEEVAKLAKLKPRVVRAIVYRLATYKGLPIGSRNQRPNGYYWITNEAERTQALAPLNSQIGQMFKRAAATSTAKLISKREALNGVKNDEPA